MPICLVVPCFNEEKRLSVRDFLDFMASHPDVRFCFVDDGSADGTRRVLELLQKERPEQVVVVGLAANSGKAEAVRQGMLHMARAGSCDFVGYWDADMSTPLTELWSIMSAFTINPSCRLAMGARFRRLGSNIERKAIRRLLGRIFSLMAGEVLDLPIHDSQCGAKVFRADVVERLFRDPFITRWLFDVELLARLEQAFGRDDVMRTTMEVPLSAWREVGGSKLRVTHMLGAPRDLWRIRARYRK